MYEKAGKHCNFALRTGSVWYRPAGKPVGSPQRKAFFGTVERPPAFTQTPEPGVIAPTGNYRRLRDRGRVGGRASRPTRRPEHRDNGGANRVDDDERQA